MSPTTDSSQPSMGPYLLVLLGLPVGMFRSVLDTVMIVSVLLALAAGAMWFIAFAGSPLSG